MTNIDWTHELSEQLDWHWQAQARPRLTGLTDAEYFWEPAPKAWNVRPRGTGSAPVNAGTGDFTIDFAFPQPIPAPVTTIAWRLGHVLVGVLGERNASHFGAPPCDYDTYRYPESADLALADLDEKYATWIGGVRALRAADLATACGAAEGPFGEQPMATLILHINRELIHHLAEIALLRDLYPHPRS